MIGLSFCGILNFQFSDLAVLHLILQTTDIKGPKISFLLRQCQACRLEKCKAVGMRTDCNHQQQRFVIFISIDDITNSVYKGDPLISLDFFENAMTHPGMKIQVLLSPKLLLVKK